MPIKERKVRGKNCYKVTHGGKVSAKCSPKKKADAQVRLLRGLSHGMKLKKK